jgi:hypothetical protein
MPKRLVILPGLKYNRLTIVRETDPEIRYSNGRETPLRRFDCVCDCGKPVNARISSLINGTTKSCGCLKNENVLLDRVTHGKSKEVLYHIWGNMIQRCENSKVKKYKNYGGRGISVCQEWRNDFMAFYNWSMSNGWKQGLEIDRENNDGNYEPGNCRIVTRKINCNNTRRCRVFNLNGENLTLTQICNRLSINYSTVHQRIFKYKWSFEKAIIQ